MYSRPRLALKFLIYYFTASNGKGHGIHSPFAFDFIRNVLNDKRQFYAFSQIERLKEELLKDSELLTIEDFGGGSSMNPDLERTVADIAKRASVSSKFGQLLFRISHYYQPQQIIELGCSLGMSAAYMALGNKSARLITMEGCQAIADKAASNFRSLALTNVQLIKGNFDALLPDLLSTLHTVDLAFIDGNHRKSPVLRYFDLLMKKRSANAIFIVHDIHWSREMEEAWAMIRDHEAVMLTIDLFFAGIIFFNEDFKVKQHFIIRI